MRRAIRQLALSLIVLGVLASTAISPAPVAAAPDARQDNRPAAQYDPAAAVVERVRHALQHAAAFVADSFAADAAAEEPLPVEEDPDWSYFSAGDAGIWLPDSFIGGSLEDDLPLIADTLRAQGGDYAVLADMIEQNQSLFQLFAFDPSRGESGVLTNMNITRETVLSIFTTELYLDSVAGDLPEQFQIIEQKQVALPGIEDASRVVTSVAMPGAAAMKQALYAVKDGNTIWMITFTTGEPEFDDMLPIFERSAMSFSLATE